MKLEILNGTPDDFSITLDNKKLTKIDVIQSCDVISVYTHDSYTSTEALQLIEALELAVYLLQAEVKPSRPND